MRPHEEDRPQAKGIQVTLSDLGLLSNKPVPVATNATSGPISSRRTQEELLREQQLEEEHDRKQKAAQKEDEPSGNPSNTWEEVLNDSSMTFGENGALGRDKAGEPTWPKKSQPSSKSKYENVVPVSWRANAPPVRGAKLKSGN